MEKMVIETQPYSKAIQHGLRIKNIISAGDIFEGV